MSLEVPSLSVEYRSATQLPPATDSWWHDCLGMASFHHTRAPQGPSPVPIAQVVLPPLNTPAPTYELWRSAAPMRSGQLGDARYRCSEHLLFGCLEIMESTRTLDAGDALRSATSAAYAQVFAVLDTTGFSHLLRVWNFMADINQTASPGERYWHFNSARHDSFTRFEHADPHSLPAASAVGTPNGEPLVIYFLAARGGVQMFENPRQVSAYQYPAQYGPRSPSFSRATLLSGRAHTLLISGTASIVGHQSRHADDVIAQTTETIANISALLDCANDHVQRPGFELRALTYKVYLRRSADCAAVAKVLRKLVGPMAPIAIFTANVCRRDLLVEIEAAGPQRVCA